MVLNKELMKAIVFTKSDIFISKLRFCLADLGYFYLLNKADLQIILFLFEKTFHFAETICFISSLFSFLQMAINIYFIALSISIPKNVAK